MSSKLSIIAAVATLAAIPTAFAAHRSAHVDRSVHIDKNVRVDRDVHVNKNVHIDSNTLVIGHRYHGGVWYGHTRRYWHGQWWDYGVGACWLLTPIGYVWVCD